MRDEEQIFHGEQRPRLARKRKYIRPSMGMPGGDIYDWEQEEPWTRMLNMSPEEGSLDAQILANEIASADPDAEMDPWVRKNLVIGTLPPVTKLLEDAMERRRQDIERLARINAGIINAYPWIVDQYGDDLLDSDKSVTAAAAIVAQRMISKEGKR